MQLDFASDWPNLSGNSLNGQIWTVSVEVLIYAVRWALRPMLAGVGWPELGAILLWCPLGNLLGAWTRVSMCGFYFLQRTAVARLLDQLDARNGWRMAAALVLVALGAIRLAWGGAILRESLGIQRLAGAAVLLLAFFERAARHCCVGLVSDSETKLTVLTSGMCWCIWRSCWCRCRTAIRPNWRKAAGSVRPLCWEPWRSRGSHSCRSSTPYASEFNAALH